MTTTQTMRGETGATAVDRGIALASAAFIAILAIAAYWDPTIRVLHVFEAIPYVAAPVLCVRQHKRAGYMLAFGAGAFWLWSAGTLTTFVRGGFQRVAMLLRTGTVDRWDVFIAAPAAFATGALILLSVWGYSRMRLRKWRDIAGFAAAFVGVGAYFILLFWALAPQYLQMFKRFVR